MEFHKLLRSGSGMTITHKKAFPPDAHAFKTETIKTVFDFAFDMTFGDKGEHRNHRTGGTIQRKKGEIFDLPLNSYLTLIVPLSSTSK